MTVAELIEKLKDAPQDLDVTINAYGEEKDAEKVYIFSDFGNVVMID